MENKLRKMIAIMVAVTVAGLLLLLPYRLYMRDTEVAQQHARVVSDELSNMIKLTMLTTKDVLALNPKLGLGVVYEKVEKLYKKFEENQDFQFRVVRSPIIENQYTAIKGRSPDNDQIKEVLNSGKSKSSIEGANLTYWSPIRADAQCGHCHRDLKNKKVKEGTVLGVVETTFDLTKQRSRSIRTIMEITGFLLIMIFILAFVILSVIRTSLVKPLQDLADIIRRRKTKPDTPLPLYQTPEMAGLVDALRNSDDDKPGARPL